MDIRLFEAFRTGDIQLLYQLLAKNPLLLHTLALASSENPLHEASIAGHVDFVKEIVRFKPDFAKEINNDGFSPMHIAFASANGYLEIVRELLKVDPRLYQLKGRDEWTPLHYAASRGRVDVVVEMVLTCPESVEDVTIQGETSLHLAVKRSQFEAIKALVELVREMNKVNILNIKDNNGNSVLHLAGWKTRKHQVVEWLVGINGITPETPQLQQPNNLMEYFKFKKGSDSTSNACIALLVVAVLWELQICIIAMYCNYTTAMTIIAPDNTKAVLIVFVFTSVLPGFVSENL
ncbi:unnamed protein product [Prunus armeniaca]|uniref:Uncharacterized protein n=1 Tax=Prunus armeniaca TaxID=36596 RepID=A0A6J5U4S3_PRUAR|nr:unnamed protein product [Prunus armeniaca]